PHPIPIREVELTLIDSLRAYDCRSGLTLFGRGGFFEGKLYHTEGRLLAMDEVLHKGLRAVNHTQDGINTKDGQSPEWALEVDYSPPG
ncbi:hypothetical protein KAU11_06820, partial [Candidatus Babeliales bacterium]|nr:hypothetical protein [Candidatus Babeliales bacterium]